MIYYNLLINKDYPLRTELRSQEERPYFLFNTIFRNPSIHAGSLFKHGNNYGILNGASFEDEKAWILANPLASTTDIKLMVLAEMARRKMGRPLSTKKIKIKATINDDGSISLKEVS